MAIPWSGDELRMCDCSEPKIPDRRAIKILKNKQSHITVQPKLVATLQICHFVTTTS